MKEKQMPTDKMNNTVQLVSMFVIFEHTRIHKSRSSWAYLSSIRSASCLGCRSTYTHIERYPTRDHYKHSSHNSI